ncbi:FAS1-like dehydratase domain-containing protein [Halalkalibacter alkalisediminis]|uniref:MaoC family dehydratase N-terminal domain-containing protein n=1 Tax=Halalkalibacter alkalisediminis TaxID=935616 RepID=A0ABV6NQ16_9BACI|nr:MaoC family dehydratase N-terminal domain-containing protein [Halalkalibacter alkalisediminis]
MIDEIWDGSFTKPIKITVTREMIAAYAKSIDIDSEIYVDIEFAKKAGYDNIPAPPTMPIIFWQYFDVPWLQDAGPLIHRKQRFLNVEPLLASRTYVCSIQLLNVKKKQNKHGMMQLSNHKLIVSYNDCIHATAITTLIIKEK